MDEVSVEQLKIQIQLAADCASVTLPAHQLSPLLELATRAPHTNRFFTIERLRKRIWEAEVELAGDEIRRVLALALQAKLAENNIVPFKKRATG